MAKGFLFPKGAEWRKWDLHAHTPIDSDWINRPNLLTEDDKILFARNYISRALQKELSVIAITDHNFCNDISCLLIPYIQREASAKNITILPGFELTITDCGGVHVLAIFPEDSELNTIDQIVTQLFPAGSPRISQDGSAQASNADLDKLYDILKKSTLDFLLLFAHADGAGGVLNAPSGQNRARLWGSEYVSIAQLSRSTNEYPSDSFYCKVFNGLNDDYRKDMAYITASDCRSIVSEGLPAGRAALGDKYTWIKADPTFEGLRQIIYEPKARVRIQIEKPEEKPSHLVIDKVKYVDSSGKYFSDSEIEMNPCLNVIIGGKSTGKSILLTHIANTIDSSEVDSRLEISKINRYDFDSVDFEVHWSNGDVDLLSKPEYRKKITYIPQLYINKVVENNNRSALKEIALNFLRQSEEFRQYYEESSSAINALHGDISSHINTLFDLLDTRQNKYTALFDVGDKKAITKELESISHKIEILRKESGFNEEETILYGVLTEKNAQHENTITEQMGLLNALEKIYSIVLDIPESLKSNYDEFMSEEFIFYEVNPSTKEIIEKVIDDINEKMRSLTSSLKDEYAKNKEDIEKHIEKQKEELTKCQNSLVPYLSKIQNQDTLKELQDNAKHYEGQIKQIKGIEKEIKAINIDITKVANKIIEDYFNVIDSYEEYLNELNSEKYSKIGDEIRFSANLVFDANRYNERFCKLFDLRSSLNRLHPCFDNNNMYIWDAQKHKNNFLCIYQSIIDTSRDDLRMRGDYQKKDAVDALLSDHFKIEYNIYQNNEEIMKMSPGKQGLVLLELFLHLSNSRHPILIDQPEDNLDNRTIFTQLSTFIKNKKKDRQIILVSHNPNLVVTTDAELIIVANQDGQDEGTNEKYLFEYVSGSLECTFEDKEQKCILLSQGIRQHVCDVLEGGEEAFLNREKKYAIMRNQVKI